MEYTKLGRTGLDVSRICLGCMSYGGGNRGNHAWSLGEEESRPFIKRALEAGINFFDTANRYSLGSSEEILGHAIKDFARRNEIVILVGESQCNLRDEKRADWPNQQPGPARSRNVLPSSVPSACASAMAPSRWPRIS